MENLIDFFPKTVYYCDCLKNIIKKCLKPCSLQHICDEINDCNGIIVYCARCGDNKEDVVFSCADHLLMGTFTAQFLNGKVTVIETNRKYCFCCIKKNLQEKYYNYNSEIFKKS